MANLFHTGIGSDTLADILRHAREFESLVYQFPQVRHGFMFMNAGEGERYILGRFENDNGMVTFYPNGAHFGMNIENWG